MECQSCGADLIEGARFCRACGAPVEGSAAPSTPPDNTTTEITPATDASEAAVAAEGGQRVGPADDPDRYELAQVRSRGGEGELWRGAIRVDGQPLDVAVKIIHPANVADIEEWSERWRRQAEILRSLEHPGLVKVREVFEGPLPHAPGGADASTRSLYLVMNWVSGTSLPEWVTLNPERDILESTRVVNRLAAAVDYLHSGKATGTPVLHRDIKPANVIVDGGDVRLVDFGFAHLAAAPDMTMAGTPAYLAPEVVGGAPPTEASDNYSLGATAYFALVGENPTPNDVNAMRTKLMAVGGVEGREDFADHVLAMMSRDPARRPSRAVEWAQSLAVGAISETLISDRRLSAPSDPDPEPGPATRPKKRRGWLVAAIVVVVLVVGGGAAALVASSGGSSSDGGKASPSTRKEATAAAAATATMPDVVGQTLEDAKATLRKRKVTDLTVQEQESSEPVGTVIEQDPVAGAKSSGSATLTVAKAVGTMPDVTGKTLSVATNTLKSLGATVTANDTLDDTKPDGTVVSQDPAAGSPFSPNVTLQVARQPVVTYLADLDAVEGSPVTGVPATLSGQTYTHAVVQLGGPGGSKIGYDLGRHYRKLKATAGLRDDNVSNASARIEILADGRSIFSQTANLGQTFDIDLDVTNVLRLELIVTELDKNCCSTPRVVWGDIRVLGAPSEVPGSAADTSSGSATTTTSTTRP